MILTSPAFDNDGKIPCKYTCDGENMSPPLIISDVPPGAKSLVLILDEPEPPKGAFAIDHWLVFDIPRVNSMSQREKHPKAPSARSRPER